MSAGSVLAAVGCAMLGLASTPRAYIAGWLVLGAAMRMILYDAAFASLAQIAGRDARRAISYLTLFGGLASTAFWPLSHGLSSHMGWHNTFLVFAAINLLICLPLHFGLLAAGNAAVPPESSPAAQAGQSYLSGRERTVAMVLFATVLSLNGFVFSSLSAHIVPLFEKLGFTPALGVTLAALIGPSQVASRIGEILFGARSQAVKVAIVACAFLPTAFVAIWIGQYSWEAAVAFSVLYGMSNGLVTIMRGAVPLALFGPSGFGLVLGTLATPQLVLNALAPTLFAMVIDGLGVPWAMAICFAFSLMSLAAMIQLARLHPR